MNSLNEPPAVSVADVTMAALMRRHSARSRRSPASMGDAAMMASSPARSIQRAVGAVPGRSWRSISFHVSATRAPRTTCAPSSASSCCTSSGDLAVHLSASIRASPSRSSTASTAASSASPASASSSGTTPCARRSTPSTHPSACPIHCHSRPSARITSAHATCTRGCIAASSRSAWTAVCTTSGTSPAQP